MKYALKRVFLILLSLTLLLSTCGIFPAAFAEKTNAGGMTAACCETGSVRFPFFRQILTRLSMLCELLRRLFGGGERKCGIESDPGRYRR